MYLHLKRTSLVFLQGVERLWRAASAESASADCQSEPLDPSPAHVSLHPARIKINYTTHFICIYALDRYSLKAKYKIKCKIPAILVCLFSVCLFVCAEGSGRVPYWGWRGASGWLLKLPGPFLGPPAFLESVHNPPAAGQAYFWETQTYV